MIKKKKFSVKLQKKKRGTIHKSLLILHNLYTYTMQFLSEKCFFRFVHVTRSYSKCVFEFAVSKDDLPIKYQFPIYNLIIVRYNFAFCFSSNPNLYSSNNNSSKKKKMTTLKVNCTNLSTTPLWENLRKTFEKRTKSLWKTVNK